MNIKKNIIAIIIGVGAVIIFAVIGFSFYINSDTVKVNRQPELAQQYLLEEDCEQAIADSERIESNETDVQSQQDATAEEMPTAEAQTCLEEAGNDNWKSAYIDYFQDNNDYISQYELIFLDNDNIPEIAAYPLGAPGGGCSIINYSDGTVYETYLARNFYTYIERANLLCHSWAHMGVEVDTVYSIIDGKMTVIADGEIEYGFEEDTVSYYWNRRKVTETEYYAELNKVYDQDKDKEAVEVIKAYTYDEFVDIITNFG